MLPRTLAITAVAILAVALPSLRAAAQPCSSGPCHTPHSQPGCSVAECCQEVCAFLPKCCSVEWDQLCVEYAEVVCQPIGVCGLSTAGSCFAFSVHPACRDSECCEKVCGVDPHCCTEMWDANCVQLAFTLCSTAGGCGASTESCLEPHPSGGCADADCCRIVCTTYPMCCDVAWDMTCVSAAECFCYGECEVTCPLASIPELEACGQKLNDPCYNPGATVQGQSIPTNLPICGRLFVNFTGGVVDADVDVFVAELGIAGQGQVTATLFLTSGERAWAALVPAPPFGECNPLEMAVAHTSSFHTVMGTAQACVPAGRYWVVVSAGEFPHIGMGDLFPCDDGRYVVGVTYTAGCILPCVTSTEPCFAPHASPGCGSPGGCCGQVCPLDPFCCDVSWDTACAALAASLCDAPPPPNDDCAAPLPIGAGETPFTTIAATGSAPDLPTSCTPGTFPGMDGDVWFLYEPMRSGPVELTTCGRADFDTRLAVYRGDRCPPEELLACSDDDPRCEEGPHSTVTLEAKCGERYLVRIGSHLGGSGTGTLTVTELGSTPCACPGDVNGDGVVTGADLTALLGQWGPAGGGGVADFNGDGVVDGVDLTILLGQWGGC